MVKLALALPLAGSVTVALPTLRLGGVMPLSRMLPWPWFLPMLPRLALVRFSAKLEVPLASMSCSTATVTTLLVSPGAKVSVPAAAVYSCPAWAVPSCVA